MTAAVTLGIIESLVRQGSSAADVVIFTPYTAQANVYKTSLGLMDLGVSGFNIGTLQVKTVDGFQGSETPIVILNLTILEQLLDSLTSAIGSMLLCLVFRRGSFPSPTKE